MQSSAFRYDLADVCRQGLSDKARELLSQCKAAAHNKKEFSEKSAEFMALFPLTADILATHECFLLGSFLEGAEQREAGTKGEMTRNRVDSLLLHAALVRFFPCHGSWRQRRAYPRDRCHQ